ncbi:DHH family phosphoesterase, partial [Breznakiellaceae bacterium SP9]
EDFEEGKRYGQEGRDSDMLYMLLQSVKGMEAVAVLRQETLEKCTIGLRSRDTVDVSTIAAVFGGGGHKNAAGASYQGTIAELKPKILAEFKNILGAILT